jgi:hypothetical protein
MPEGLLLHASPDLIHGGGPDFHDMKSVQHGDGVLELVIEGVLVALERIQGRDLDPVTERVVAFLQPVRVDGSRPSGFLVEQSRASLSLAVTRKIDHPGQFLRSASAVLDGLGADVMADVLVDAEGRDAAEAGPVIGHLLQQRPDRRLHGAPRRPELPRQAQDRRTFATDLIDRPPARPRRQQGPRSGDGVVLLGEHPRRAVRLGAPPRPLAPRELNRPTEARCVDQPHLATSVAAHHDAQARQPSTLAGDSTVTRKQGPRPADHLPDGGHVQPVEADEKITAGAAQVSRAGASRRRRLGHGRGLRIESLVAIDPPEASTPNPAAQTRESVTPTSGTKRPLASIHRDAVSLRGS